MKKSTPIISASRRTDIPAFFGEWFMNRLRAGFCRVRNPFNPRQVSRVELTPETVKAFVFWTRNPTPFRPHLTEIRQRGFRFVFLVTVTGYPAVLEPAVPTVEEAIAEMRLLAEAIGPASIAWRYDPLLLSNEVGAEWHRQNFARLAAALEGQVHHVITSFADFYRKTTRGLKPLIDRGWEFLPSELANPGESTALLRDLHDIATGHGLDLRSCCEEGEPFSEAAIKPGACIDFQWLNGLHDLELADRRDPGQRDLCRCFPSIDIGAPDTCGHGCLYCYATRSPLPEGWRHDPNGEFLVDPVPNGNGGPLTPTPLPPGEG